MDSNKPKNSDKRLAPISIRPPARLSDEFYARAKNSGLSMNAFIMEAIFGSGFTTPIMDKKSLGLLLSQAGRINSHLEEMGHSSTETQNLLILEECRHELSEIRTALLAGMRGEEP
jgi:hypothetical protein